MSVDREHIFGAGSPAVLSRRQFLGRAFASGIGVGLALFLAACGGGEEDEGEEEEDD